MLVHDGEVVGRVSGGMTPARDGLTLAERSALSRSAGSTTGAGSAALTGERPVVDGELAGSGLPRHCWVTGSPAAAGRAPGLLLASARRAGSWYGRVSYPLVDEGKVVVVEAWVPADRLEPAS